MPTCQATVQYVMNTTHAILQEEHSWPSIPQAECLRYWSPPTMTVRRLILMEVLELNPNLEHGALWYETMKDRWSWLGQEA
jgi:hypothetical protein